MDLASEKAMYALLQELNTTYISVGHRPSLLRYHTRRLVLRGEGLDPITADIEQLVRHQKLDAELMDLTSVT